MSPSFSVKTLVYTVQLFFQQYYEGARNSNFDSGMRLNKVFILNLVFSYSYKVIIMGNASLEMYHKVLAAIQLRFFQNSYNECCKKTNLYHDFFFNVFSPAVFKLS